MSDRRGGNYYPDENQNDNLYDYGDEGTADQSYADNADDPNAFDEQGGGYTYASGPQSAADRIAEQRRSMRTGTRRLSPQERGRQRQAISLVTLGCIVLLVGVFVWLLLRDVGNKNTIANVQPSPTRVALRSSPTLAAGVPTVGSGVAEQNTPNPAATLPPPPPTPTSVTGGQPSGGQPTVAAPPPAAPTKTPAPNNNANNPASIRKYTVNGGDTMLTIAQQFGVNTGQLMAANNDVILHPSQLQAGQSINIPAPSYSPPNVKWQVQPGEYLLKIINDLQATDTSTDKIAAANPCQSPAPHGVCQPGFAIFPGDTITIPFH